MPSSTSENTQIPASVHCIGEKAFARSIKIRKLDARSPVSSLAIHFLFEQFQAILREEPRAKAGVDPEGVHQMRVATRRVRALLRTLKKTRCLATFRKLEPDFKWLASELGGVRDLDVYLEKLHDYRREFPEEYLPGLSQYEQRLESQREAARRQLVSSLASERYQQLMQAFAQFLEVGPQSDEQAQPSIGEAAQRWIDKQYRSVLRDGRSINSDSPDERLHNLCIDCKRLRYLLEFFRPIYGNRLKVRIRQLKRLQDILGLIQDAHVATVRLQHYAESLDASADEYKKTLIAVGQLMCMQRQQIKEQREAFFAYWPEFDHRGARRAIVKIVCTSREQRE